MKTRLMLALALVLFMAPLAVFAQAASTSVVDEPTLEAQSGITHPLHSRCVSEPKPQGAHHDTCRNDIEFAMGFSYLRFHSSQFNANTFGLNTDVSYYLKPWLTAEAEASSAWGPQSASSFLAKSFVYGGGFRVIDPRDDKVRPWAHALIGGMHMLPQTAFGRNGFATIVGAGGDLKLRYWLWLRVEANYLGSGMYAQHQNNLQIMSTVVYRF